MSVHPLRGDGGTQRDGLIELPRVPELNLGENKYAQVRIAVTAALPEGHGHLCRRPAGRRTRFTNKHKGTSFEDTPGLWRATPSGRSIDHQGRFRPHPRPAPLHQRTEKSSCRRSTSS
ncbi:MAG: hypothetical protein ACLVJ6_04895 [Merdibacter sp.]